MRESTKEALVALLIILFLYEIGILWFLIGGVIFLWLLTRFVEGR